MVKLPKIVRDFTGFIDGTNYAGAINEGKIPDIEFVTEEVSNGGMGGTVDVWMGLVAKLETELTIEGLSAEFMAQLGNPDVGLTLRGDLTDGTETQAAIFQMRGLIKKSEIGNLKRKDKGTTKVMGTLTYFKATIGGQEVAEIDVINKVCKINGTDRFAESRAALGG
jgi:P2 family phage contractile tail tube protein